MKKLKPQLFKTQNDITIDSVRKIPLLISDEIIGFKKTETFFVDSSGFGDEFEPALTFNSFFKKIKPGFYYGIVNVGQFQVYINEYIKDSEFKKSENINELKPIFGHVKSFYKKAYVINEDDLLKLRSYNTIVASINKKESVAIVYGDYSQTTLRHIKDFLKQNGFKAENKSQILKDYGGSR